MRPKISPLLPAILLLTTCSAATEAATTYSEKIKAAREAVAEILVGGQRKGTAFCVSADGYVITANHVVGRAEIINGQPTVTYNENIEVRLSDGRKLAATPVVNPSPEAAYHDSALLKIEAKTPHYLKLGNAGTLSQGEEVYVVGFPFDVPTTVAYRGFVSAQFEIPAGTLNGRAISNSTIHVQIPIAKGFSGAALIRMSDDSVVGIVTNKLGGITTKLDEIRVSIVAGQRTGGRALILGVDPNDTALELINTLDLYLSAGAGWAVSPEYIKPLLDSRKN